MLVMFTKCDRGSTNRCFCEPCIYILPKRILRKKLRHLTFQNRSSRLGGRIYTNSRKILPCWGKKVLKQGK